MLWLNCWLFYFYFGSLIPSRPRDLPLKVRPVLSGQEALVLSYPPADQGHLTKFTVTSHETALQTKIGKEILHQIHNDLAHNCWLDAWTKVLVKHGK